MRRLGTLLLCCCCLVAVAIPTLATAQDPPEPPVAATDPAKDLQQTTAVLVAKVTPRGADTTVRFEYGTSTSYGLTSAERSVPATATTAQTVEIPIAGLTSNTTYHFRVVATNAAGEVRGSDRSFKTVSPPATPRAPSVSTTGVRSVTATSGILVGRVDPNGSKTSTRFEWGTSSSLGKATGSQDAGSGDTAAEFTSGLISLTPNKRYYYRVVATNAAGTVRGSTRSFTTSRQLVKPTIVLDPSAPTFGGSVKVTGKLSGTGISGVTVALEGDEFPYGDGFRQLSTARSSSSGSYAFTIPTLYTTTQLRVVTRTTPASVSDVAYASARLRVGMLPPTRALPRRARLARFTGRVFPSQPGARASLQRRNGAGRWVPVQRGRLRSDAAGRTRYVLRGRVPKAGATFRVVVTPLDGGHARGISRERTVSFR